MEGNELVLTLGVDSQTANVFEPGVDEQQAPAGRGNQVNQIDFRRGETGEGRIVINLSNPSIPVDVREERGRIQVRFVGAAIPEALRRRLDVTDFATPVRYVDASMDGETGVVSHRADRQLGIPRVSGRRRIQYQCEAGDGSGRVAPSPRCVRIHG